MRHTHAFARSFNWLNLESYQAAVAALESTALAPHAHVVAHARIELIPCRPCEGKNLGEAVVIGYEARIDIRWPWLVRRVVQDEGL